MSENFTVFFVSADLRTGELKLKLPDSSSGFVSFSDVLHLVIPDLGANDKVTVTFELDVEGTYARAVGQDIGQASFSFNAVSGLNTTGLVDQVAGTALYRTSSGSDTTNTTTGAVGPADFSHTAGISLSLPTNATFTSDSEVSLSQRSPTTPVPEPASLALLGLGLAGLGFMRRRRRA